MMKNIGYFILAALVAFGIYKAATGSNPVDYPEPVPAPAPNPEPEPVPEPTPEPKPPTEPEISPEKQKCIDWAKKKHWNKFKKYRCLDHVDWDR